ncbi:transcription elongation regulator 1-like protein [Dromiciops gliroides]|uniref:transcription elongation regulator 1-like protein n=1 Tax=Dromiciops gliroides TaxID=33562 RepID=UPI001CC77C97|nr:transcription elongation regulator 1-like protein [Dromiciops gliroides]
MLPGPSLPRRRPRRPPQPPPQLLWQMNAELSPQPPPPCLWMVPSSGGVLRLAAGVVPPPLLLPSPPQPPPPLLPGVPSWQVPCEPSFLPLVPVPSAAPDPPAPQYPLLNEQWIFGAQSPVIGFSPSSNVDLIPIFPHVYTSALPPPVGKSWLDKRIPNYKIYLNNTFALDSTWIHPEESRLFHGHEKPHLMTNQVAMAVSRPAPASRHLPTVVLAPQPIPVGCPNGLKQVGGHPTIAITSAAMVSVEPEELRAPLASTVQPCHVLTLAPIKIPLLTAPFSGSASQMESRLMPLLPAQVTRVTAVSTPAVTFMTANLMEQASPDKGKESGRSSCPPTLILHTERQLQAPDREDKDPSLLINGDESSPRGNKPVASTPVPGSPWCVVWTGDDRVFFFNPTMHLSVWEKPMDLKNRGDLNRIIEDPPHKRKLDASATDKSDGSDAEDESEDQNMKTKRNKLEGPQNIELEKPEKEDRGQNTPPHQILLPLEERATHFRDMLLERGVSAFSTWEKELHKIVFDPRYLLLNSDERKQIFEQFVKTRIKEEYKERKSKLLLAKEEFRKLLEESKLSPRTTFKEFAEKYGRDQRFRLVQKKKDQEQFFNQFIMLLKKRDKENRIRLRKMR